MTKNRSNLQYEKNILNLRQRNRNCYVGDAEISLMNDFAFDMGLLSFYFFGFYQARLIDEESIFTCLINFHVRENNVVPLACDEILVVLTHFFLNN